MGAITPKLVPGYKKVNTEQEVPGIEQALGNWQLRLLSPCLTHSVITGTMSPHEGLWVTAWPVHLLEKSYWLPFVYHSLCAQT